jgi:hypothetical protein
MGLFLKQTIGLPPKVFLIGSPSHLSNLIKLFGISISLSPNKKTSLSVGNSNFGYFSILLFKYNPFY